MSTSANVIEYRIENRWGEMMGSFRKHLLCKLPDYADLLDFQPLQNHTITPWGYDEEDEYWEGNKRNLRDFLYDIRSYNKTIKEYFENEKK
jgi:hypothetical protein